MPVVQVKNNGIHVQEINKGAPETVFMIHGLFSNLSIFYFHIAPMLARQQHVVLYDLKSHGMSQRVASGYDLDTMTDELLVLMDSLNVASAHLVGYSYGGLVALKMAMRYPHKVNKLALIEAPDPSDQDTLNHMDTYSRDALVEYVNDTTDGTKARMGKRQLEKNHRMYEFLFNNTTMKEDMYHERNLFRSPDIIRLPHNTLLIYGSGSDCIGAGYYLHLNIMKSDLIFMRGDHNVPIQKPLDIGSALCNFFGAPTPCA